MKIPKIYQTRLRERCVRVQLPTNARDQKLTKPCLVWQGAKDNKGYGVIRLRPKNGDHSGDMGLPSGIVRTHRLAYWIAFGPFPKNCQIDHKCRRRLCCEPEHLMLVGPSEHAGISNRDRWLEQKLQNLRVVSLKERKESSDPLPPADDSEEVL